MKNIKLIDQLRIIHDPDNEEETEIPIMPILVLLNNGVLGETKSIRGAAALAAGMEYLNASDQMEDWILRVSAARKESMYAISRGIFAEVYDKRKGIIPNNYAAEPGDPDYENDEEGESVKIHVENEKAFLLSLVKIGAIKVFERLDSFQFRPHEGWENIKKDNSLKVCKNCLHKTPDIDNGGIFCPVYADHMKNTDGSICSSYALPMPESIQEYTGGEYIDISMEYDIDELMSML